MSSRPRILLVDDEEDLRRLLRLVLQRSGFEIAGEAGDGRSAVEAATLLAPDVVVMDLNLPGMNGIEATREITTAAPAMPVVFYTAYSDDSLRGAAEEAGAVGWVLKGGGSRGLLEALEGVLATRLGGSADQRSSPSNVSPGP